MLKDSKLRAEKVTTRFGNRQPLWRGVEQSWNSLLEVPLERRAETVVAGGGYEVEGRGVGGSGHFLAGPQLVCFQRMSHFL